MNLQEKRHELLIQIQTLQYELGEVEAELKKQNQPGLDELKTKIIELAEKYNQLTQELDLDAGCGILESQGKKVNYLLQKPGKNYTFPEDLEQ